MSYHTTLPPCAEMKFGSTVQRSSRHLPRIEIDFPEEIGNIPWVFPDAGSSSNF